MRDEDDRVADARDACGEFVLGSEWSLCRQSRHIV